MPRLRMIQGGRSDAPEPRTGLAMFLRRLSYKRETELRNAFWALYVARRREETAEEEAKADPGSGPRAPRPL